jgi:transcriptional regulator of acetoin/glycerol metabolism
VTFRAARADDPEVVSMLADYEAELRADGVVLDVDEGGAVRADELSATAPELFPEGPSGRPATLAALRRESDRERIARAVAECGGNQSAAARRLGIGRTTLWRKLNGRA